MSDALDRTPPFLFSDDTQDDLRRGRDALRALALALGGAALRLDLDADRLTVRLRTP